MTQRRDFLKQAGLLATVFLAKPGALLAAPKPVKAGLQLYTLRDYIGKDAKGVLAKVAKAGYADVETYGYSPKTGFWGLNPKEFKAVLAGNGLTTSSGHYDVGSYLSSGSAEDLKAAVAAAAASGQQHVVVPYLDEKIRTTADDFKAIADKLNKAGELCKSAGLKLGYHNHDFEFKPMGDTTLYAVLLKETDPALVDFEMDMYWVVRAGQDPLALLQAHPRRFPLWHVKDMDKAQPELNTEVGAGSIDYRKIFQHAAAAGLQHAFMEQENFAMDAYASITQSATYLKKQLLPSAKKA